MKHLASALLALVGMVVSVPCARAIPPAASATCASATSRARAWRLSHERDVLAEFAGLLAIPNLASDSANIERNAARIAGMLRARGVAVRLLRVPGAPPLVVGDLPAPGASRTIAFYAHYDGQPTDSASWNGLPWTPVLRDPDGRPRPIDGGDPLDPESRLYARSAGDDKAPIVAMLAALDALRAANRAPRCGLKFVFEGEEEAGSPHLGAYLATFAGALRADAWVIGDGPVHPSRRMELAFGARGTTTLDLTVFGPVKGLHDGHYGNWVPNPIVRLTHLIDSMRDEDGRILVDGFSDDVVAPSAAELAALDSVPDIEPQLRHEFEIGGVEGGRPLNERLMLPALNVRGIQSGAVGERASNTIPTLARASIDFRLVPAQTPATVREHVERHLKSHGWTIVDHVPDAAERAAHEKLVQLAWGPGYPAARTPLDAPFSLELRDLLVASGHPPVRLPTLGGSVPMYLFQQPRGTPVVILPVANHDDNQHAPNENLRLRNLWDAIEMYAGVFAGLSR